MRSPYESPTRNVLLSLTTRQAYRLRLLLIGEIAQPGIDETHRRTWREIVAKLERAIQET